MPACHIPAATPSFSDALHEVRALMAQVEAGELSFSEYEQASRGALRRLGRSMDAVALGREDLDAPVIWVDGVRCPRVGRWEAPYLGCWGEVRIERSLYRRAGEDRTLCPLELRAGIVEGYWTPAAASLATWSVAHRTPAEAAELFKRSGGMSPSRSTLDRLPKARATETSAGGSVTNGTKDRGQALRLIVTESGAWTAVRSRIHPPVSNSLNSRSEGLTTAA